jgi:lipid-A-disaccharide synthase
MKIMICAMEKSADSLGAGLVEAANASKSNFHWYGTGGPEMEAAGVHLAPGIALEGSIGPWEAAKHMPQHVRGIRALQRLVVDTRPDLLLTIDSPSALLRVAATAKAHNIPSVHWVSPQVWAWRPGRVKKISRVVDELWCLFPMEPSYYRDTGLRCRFVGHPLAWKPNQWSYAGLKGRTVALLPGSRRAECLLHWPAMVDAARLLHKRDPNIRFICPVAHPVNRLLTEGLPISFVPALNHKNPFQADCAIAASGTATLELAIRGIPMVVIYKTHPITWQLGRQLVSGVEHISLPNILLQAPVLPEFLQDISPVALADAAAELLLNSEMQQNAFHGLRESLLGCGGYSACLPFLDEVVSGRSCED